MIGRGYNVYTLDNTDFVQTSNRVFEDGGDPDKGLNDRLDLCCFLLEDCSPQRSTLHTTAPSLANVSRVLTYLASISDS